jgi:hypothetical protein
MKMDIGDQGDMDPGTDLMNGHRSRLIGNGDADDFTARLLQRVDLRYRRPNISVIAGGHGLDHDRCVAADPDTSEIKGFRFSSSDLRTQ